MLKSVYYKLSQNKQKTCCICDKIVENEIFFFVMFKTAKCLSFLSNFIFFFSYYYLDPHQSSCCFFFNFHTSILELFISLLNPSGDGVLISKYPLFSLFLKFSSFVYSLLEPFFSLCPVSLFKKFSLAASACPHLSKLITVFFTNLGWTSSSGLFY